MKLKTTLNYKTYDFKSVKDVLAKSSEEKSGDILAGIAARDRGERIAAKYVLSELTVKDLTENPAVSYEEDAVTRLILDDLDQQVYKEIKNKTIGEMREYLLDHQTTGDMMLRAGKGMSSEVISAISKLMSNMDLVYAGKKMQIYATCNTTIGGPNVLGTRLQPNHPTDDLEGVLTSTLYGLSYGIGDAVLGINPVIDTVDNVMGLWHLLNSVKETLEIPTQTCVLAHVSTQMEALKKGGKADLCFQSLAGSEKACLDFGITLDMLAEAKAMFFDAGKGKIKNQMYFETGQGSELSSSGHFDSDQVTMECRCYGLARHYDPFLVNTVVGFIGPEYIYDSKQLIRAGLEDVFNGHLHGLPMGCDACYTNHMLVDQNDNDILAMTLAQSGCHYFMGVPQGDDVMLMYQSTGFHDNASLREITGKKPIKEFEQWCKKYGFLNDQGLGANFGNPRELFYKMKKE